MLDESIFSDFKVHQEHDYFTVFDNRNRIAINCLLPTRVLQDIFTLSPKILSRMKRVTCEVINIEDYSAVEKSAFKQAVKFLQYLLPRLHFKPFRLSKVA